MEISTRIHTDRSVALQPESAPARGVPEKSRASTEIEHEDVLDTPENRTRIDRAIRALDIFNPNHPNTRFRFSVHDTGRIQVELYNYLTGEVVQTIPSTQLLDYAARMQELSGLVFEKHA